MQYFPKDNIMADAFFRVFDEDKSGALSFYEYMLVKTAPKLESQEDRLGWIFHAFDSDGGGSIDNTEVTRQVTFKLLSQNILFKDLQAG